MSLWGAVTGRGPAGFGYDSTAEEVTQGLALEGRTVVVTGCNSGLGLETVRVLCQRGAQVLALARTVEKAQAVAASFGAQVTPLECELAEPASVRACVQAVKALGRPLDAIICNAGIMALPTLQQAYGYELQFFTNHIGHFILVTGLIDQLASKGRVVVLSSGAHKYAPRGGIVFDNLSGEKGYWGWTQYGQSKLANLLFARELGRRFEGTERIAIAVHPGVISTNLSRSMNLVVRGALRAGSSLVLKNAGQGAATQCFAAVHPAAARFNGEYLAHCKPARSSAYGRDVALAARLWQESERIVAELEGA